MSWNEFVAFLGAMKREVEAGQVSVDSWKNAEHDEWWVNARREREEQRAG